MANYLFIENYTKKGKLGISLDTFNALVEGALERVPDIAQSKDKLKRNQRVYFNKPVQTNIIRGILHIAIYIDAKKGTDLVKIDKAIREEIENTLLVSTEQVPFDIQVKVVSLF